MGFLDVDESFESLLHVDRRAADGELVVGRSRLVGELGLNRAADPGKPDPGVGVEASRSLIRLLQDLSGPIRELDHPDIVAQESQTVSRRLTRFVPGRLR